MNINKKFIIIFGVSTLLIITIFGLKAYYQERDSQTMPISSEDISFKKIFDKNYPSSLEETILFQRICANIVTSKPKQENEPVLCTLVEDKNYNISGKYTILPIFLKIISNLPIKQYIAIAVNYGDILQKHKSLISSEENSFNLCTITKPILSEPFREQLFENQIDINRSIVFSDGEVYCRKFFELPDKRVLMISGFVPEADFFQIKVYFVPEDKAINEFLAQESFSDIEKILQSYPLLWESEKQIRIYY